jgi:hypothetical protein
MGKKGTPPKKLKIKDNRYCYHSKVCMQVVSMPCLFEILVSHYSIQYCWRKMLAIREFQRLKQEANEVATNLIQDLRVNLLGEGENDMVQPCDSTQVRSDSDFGVKFCTIQFYTIEHNFKSNNWIELKLYQKIPEVFFYVEVTF